MAEPMGLGARPMRLLAGLLPGGASGVGPGRSGGGWGGARTVNGPGPEMRIQPQHAWAGWGAAG